MFLCKMMECRFCFVIFRVTKHHCQSDESGTTFGRFYGRYMRPKANYFVFLSDPPTLSLARLDTTRSRCLVPVQKVHSLHSLTALLVLVHFPAADCTLFAPKLKPRP